MKRSSMNLSNHKNSVISVTLCENSWIFHLKSNRHCCQRGGSLQHNKCGSMNKYVLTPYSAKSIVGVSLSLIRDLRFNPFDNIIGFFNRKFPVIFTKRLIEPGISSFNRIFCHSRAIFDGIWNNDSILFEQT